LRRKDTAVLRPVRRTNLSSTVADSLAAMIEKGKLRPGERLQPERELSELFQVSRSTIREAFKTLESRGLIEGRQGEGTFVRMQSLERLVQWSGAPISVTAREVVQLYEVRDLIEPGIVALAAERISARDLRTLQRMLDRHEQRIREGRYTSADDSIFHHRLVVATENPVLIRVLDGVMDVLDSVRDAALRAATGLRVSMDGHRAILRALEARDAKAAHLAMAAHLTQARATLLRVLRDQEPAARDEWSAGD
jgi:GntR family transcriptional repressor for pyruvate dehydrogenase complex